MAVTWITLSVMLFSGSGPVRQAFQPDQLGRRPEWAAHRAAARQARNPDLRRTEMAPAKTRLKPLQILVFPDVLWEFARVIPQHSSRVDTFIH